MKPDRPTMADVARAAGVSPTTVSHSMNGKGRVDAATREHVRRIAKEMGYVPSRVARNLALGRSDTIGILLPHLAHLPLDELLVSDWYGRMIVAAGRQALMHNRALTILPELRSAVDAKNFGLEGVILLDPIGDDPRCRVLDEARIRYVVLGHDARRPERPCVRPDTAAGILELLQHLEKQGARRVAVLCSDIEWAEGREAILAYERWAQGHGHDPIVESVRVASCKTRGQVLDAARDAARRLLGGRDRPDAMIGLFSDFGRGIVAAARDLGLDVPEDLLVAQDIDDVTAQLADPPLTAIDLRPGEQMSDAVAMLVDEPAGPVHIVVPTLLKIRTSTQPTSALV